MKVIIIKGKLFRAEMKYEWFTVELNGVDDFLVGIRVLTKVDTLTVIRGMVHGVSCCGGVPSLRAKSARAEECLGTGDLRRT